MPSPEWVSTDDYWMNTCLQDPSSILKQLEGPQNWPDSFSQSLEFLKFMADPGRKSCLFFLSFSPLVLFNKHRCQQLYMCYFTPSLKQSSCGILVSLF